MEVVGHCFLPMGGLGLSSDFVILLSKYHRSDAVMEKKKSFPELSKIKVVFGTSWIL